MADPLLELPTWRPIRTIGGGTLALVLPTADGLVLAADSRMTFRFSFLTAYCDNVEKITAIDHVERTAFLTTGNTTVWQFNDIPIAEICNHIAREKAAFAIDPIIKDAIEARPEILDNLTEVLPAVCVEAICHHVSIHPDDFQSLRGKNIFQVVVCSFNAAQSSSRIRSFSIDLAIDGTVSPSKLSDRTFIPDDPCELVLYGEANFLTDQVFNGPGLAFLGERFRRFRGEMTTVGKAPTALAPDFVIDLIEAAAKTTASVPSQTGIGGPVDVLLLGRDAHPQRIVWKT